MPRAFLVKKRRRDCDSPVADIDGVSKHRSRLAFDAERLPLENSPPQSSRGSMLSKLLNKQIEEAFLRDNGHDFKRTNQVAVENPLLHMSTDVMGVTQPPFLKVSSHSAFHRVSSFCSPARRTEHPVASHRTRSKEENNISEEKCLNFISRQEQGTYQSFLSVPEYKVSTNMDQSADEDRTSPVDLTNKDAHPSERDFSDNGSDDVFTPSSKSRDHPENGFSKRASENNSLKSFKSHSEEERRKHFPDRPDQQSKHQVMTQSPYSRHPLFHSYIYNQDLATRFPYLFSTGGDHSINPYLLLPSGSFSLNATASNLCLPHDSTRSQRSDRGDFSYKRGTKVPFLGVEFVTDRKKILSGIDGKIIKTNIFSNNNEMKTSRSVGMNVPKYAPLSTPTLVPSIQNVGKSDLGGDENGESCRGRRPVVSPPHLTTVATQGGGRRSTPGKTPQPRKYVCDVCGKAFSRSNTLVTHKRIHTGDKPFSCELCGRAFRQPGNLTRHRLTHTTVKPYVCSQCGKAFNRASNLHTHMRTHTNYKPFTCNYCGKGFHQKIDMKIHSYTHTGERPYRCDVCFKGFTLTSTLNTHRRTHVDKKPFVCQHCGKEFYQKNALKSHLLASHPSTEVQI